MKLLIVDDQLATLTGLTQGIDWKSVGFSEVETAQNAMEARISFARGVPDLMLCDIEMPVESGIDLCTWVRAQEYQTKIIFLTCHSDFAYAQEAIRLGVSDYIVQPAPYHRIREKAEKVINDIAAETSHSHMANLGKTYTSRQMEINSALLRGYLTGTVEETVLKELPDFPETDKPGFLVLLQLVKQTEKMKEWNENTLAIAIRNTVHDTFERRTYACISAYVEHNIYALAIQKKGDGELKRDDMVSRLHYLESMFDMYMPCSIAYYIRAYSDFSRLNTVWSSLMQIANSNVTGKKGLYTEQSISDKGNIYKEQFYRWNMLLKSNGPEAFEKDALAVLHQYADEGLLTGPVLLAFHRDCTRLLLAFSDSSKNEGIFNDVGNLYTEAMHSQQAMEELIHASAEYFSSENREDSQTSIARTIQEYVDEHLSDNIRKEDLADLMHLNEDYLTRIFKKETGMSIKAYIIKQKMNAARELLQSTSLSVSSVAIQLGYNNFSHFSASYKKEFGITPAEEKEKSR